MESLSDCEFWSSGNAIIYQGDARRLGRSLPVGSVDAIVTDPPYGEGLTEGDESPDSSAELLRDALVSVRHALKPAAHVVYFWSSRSVDLAIEAGKQAGLQFQRLLYMYNQQGSARPYRGWLPRVQPIVVMRAPGRELPAWRVPICELIKKAMDDGGWTCTSLAKELGCSARLVTKWTRLDDEHWSYPNESHREAMAALLGVAIPRPPEDDGTVGFRHDLYTVGGGAAKSSHPCEKPLWVVRDIVSRVGQHVLDPFCGSGTTLVAAKSLGADAIGFEISGKWCETAKERLRQDYLSFPEPESADRLSAA